MSASSTSLSPKKNDDSTKNISTKRIDIVQSLALEELAALKKVLNLQQHENYKQQEHIELLGGELDRTKDLVQVKQLEINILTDEVFDKSNKIEELGRKIEAQHVERSAFQRFAEQNKMLLLKLKDERMKSTDAQLEVQSLRGEVSELRFKLENTSQTFIQNEVKLTTTLGDLHQQLAAEKGIRERLEKEVTDLKSFVSALQQQLKFSEEYRCEQMNRSRQADYITIQRAEVLDSEYYKQRDINEKLENDLNQAVARGNILQDRLDSMTVEADRMEIEIKNLIVSHKQSDVVMNEKDKQLQRSLNHITKQCKVARIHSSQLLMKYNKIAKENKQLLESYHAINNKFKRFHSVNNKFNRLSTSTSLQTSTSSSQLLNTDDFQQHSKENNSASTLISSTIGFGELQQQTTNSYHASIQLAPVRVRTALVSKKQPQQRRPMTTSSETSKSESSSSMVSKHYVTELIGGDISVTSSISGIDTSSQVMRQITTNNNENEVKDEEIASNSILIDNNQGSTNILVPNEPTVSTDAMDSNPVGLGSVSWSVDNENWSQSAHKAILCRYLHLCTTILTCREYLPTAVQTSDIDLSDCAVADEDLSDFSEWMKIIAISELNSLDLRGNRLSDIGLLALIDWILNWSQEDFARASAFVMELANNNINSTAITETSDALTRSHCPYIKRVELLPDLSAIYIYGDNPLGSHLPPVPIIRLNFQDTDLGSLNDSIKTNREMIRQLSRNIPKNSSSRSIDSSGSGQRPPTVIHNAATPISTSGKMSSRNCSSKRLLNRLNSADSHSGNSFS